jgi:hypothetical protein
VADLTDTDTFTYSGGLYAGNTTLAVTTVSVGDATAEDVTITTGAGADTVTLSATSHVGHANTGGTLTISTRAGDDTITVTTGALLAQTIAQSVQITAGTGADTLTLTAGATNGAGATSFDMITIADGDSLVASRDKITNFTLGGAITNDYADVLDFDSAAVGTLSTTVDFGIIMSHSISNGFASFDDVASHTTALIINSANLADVLGYIEQNGQATGSTAFLYDSTGSGAADATLVYHNDTLNSLVELVGVTTATLVGTTAVTAAMIGIG